jgi:hypothetical protein
MLEDKSLPADYPFGDQSPGGVPKIGDAANFGIFKMNWYMIRQCPSAMAILGSQPASTAWKTVGATINSNPTLATQILLEGMGLWSTGTTSCNITLPYRRSSGSAMATRRSGLPISAIGSTFRPYDSQSQPESDWWLVTREQSRVFVIRGSFGFETSARRT